jgi:endonuclease III
MVTHRTRLKENSAYLARLRREAHRVSAILQSIYGSPRHNNKEDPLDELVFIILSQMTTYWSFERVYDRLKEVAPTWDMVRRMPLGRLKKTIKDAGLSNQKAPRIKAIFERIHRDFGRVTLEPLRQMPTTKAEAYLVSLPGVQRKTAKCVLMYSLKRKVLPVDTHVLRVARRLGFTQEKVISDRVHEELETAIAPADRYRFHVNALAHGRAVCLAKPPRCEECELRRFCQYYQSSK